MSRSRTPGTPRKPCGDYAVGYGRPPTATRFQPGQSGNPRGRPKGMKSVGELLEQALATRVTVQDNGRDRRMPVLEVVIRGLVNDAVRRDHKAMRAVFALLERHRQSADPGASSGALQPEDQAILDAYFGRHLGQASAADGAAAATGSEAPQRDDTNAVPPEGAP